MLLKCTQEFIEEIKTISWLETAGEPLDDNSIIYIDSWDKAIKSFVSLKWQNIILADTRNQLSEYLHIYHNERYQSWNDVVKNINKEILRYINSTVRKIVKEYDITDKETFKVLFTNSIRGACMESEYSDIIERGFCTTIVDWYKKRSYALRV